MYRSCKFFILISLTVHDLQKEVQDGQMPLNVEIKALLPLHLEMAVFKIEKATKDVGCLGISVKVNLLRSNIGLILLRPRLR